MKKHLKSFVFNWLLFCLKPSLLASPAKIIGITGSKGKSGGKEAIAAVLTQASGEADNKAVKVYKSPKNLNSEFGLALGFLGYNTQPKGVDWLKICLRASLLCLGGKGISFLPQIPQADYYVLEMGIDRPDDMAAILKLFTPETMIFLNVFEEHVCEGSFESIEAVFREKALAPMAVSKEGLVILNAEDGLVSSLADSSMDGLGLEVRAPVLWLNSEDAASRDGEGIHIKKVRGGRDGLELELTWKGKSYSMNLPHILGEVNAQAAETAALIGFLEGMKWEDIKKGLEEWRLPAGRMSKISGLRGSVLIDSSYNASVDSMKEGLKVLTRFEESDKQARLENDKPEAKLSGRKIAALGSMNGRGKTRQKDHEEIGSLAAEAADLLVFVGHSADDYVQGAAGAKTPGGKSGFDREKIHVFENSLLAGEWLAQELQSGDIVLAKGSQSGVRMEHVVKACMAEPSRAKDLLARQSSYWLNHPLA
jgi:UDP-N-acetylmuramyl pentapeptide synthase